jgi:hypothetical protein
MSIILQDGRFCIKLKFQQLELTHVGVLNISMHFVKFRGVTLIFYMLN